MSTTAQDKRVHEQREKHSLAQKKTFTKWANSFLKERGVVIEDLFEDLKDGKSLLLLLEKLSGEVLVCSLLLLNLLLSLVSKALPA